MAHGISPLKDFQTLMLSYQMQFASTYCDTLEEAIAGFINDMWQDLTAEEQAEIKRILED